MVMVIYFSHGYSILSVTIESIGVVYHYRDYEVTIEISPRTPCYAQATFLPHLSAVTVTPTQNIQIRKAVLCRV